MEDESKGKINDEFVELKSKMQSIKDVDGEENKTEKKINKNVVKNRKQEEYVDVLFNKRIVRHNMKRIQSKSHKIGSYDVCKIPLSYFDDERYILDNEINTLAYFHKDTRGKVDRIGKIKQN